ncbi:MAG: SDR family NAD(P)-dependent oxidoreductase, partial [Rubrivivax sp.]
MRYRKHRRCIFFCWAQAPACAMGAHAMLRRGISKPGGTMDLSKKVAVITGGGSGIGRAVATALAQRDVAGVALVDMSEAVEGVADKLNVEAGRTFAIPFQGNATDEKFRASVFDAISQKYGQVSL